MGLHAGYQAGASVFTYQKFISLKIVVLISYVVKGVFPKDLKLALPEQLVPTAVVVEILICGNKLLQSSIQNTTGAGIHFHVLKIKVKQGRVYLNKYEKR